VHVPSHDGHDDSSLPEVLDPHGIRQIGIGVPRANIVIPKVLDRGERRNARLMERHVIRGPDAFDHIAPCSDIAQRREPRIEDSFRRLVVLHVEAVGRAYSGIVVQVNRDLAAGGIIAKVPVDVSAGAQQALFFASPECNTDGTAGTRMNGGEDSDGFHHRRCAVRVVCGAGRRMP
jgi:hypothetical protein